MRSHGCLVAVVQRHFFSLRIALLVIAAGLACSAIDLWWHGFVVVHNPGHLVVAVAIEDGEVRRPLRGFSRDYWGGRPTLAE